MNGLIQSQIQDEPVPGQPPAPDESQAHEGAEPPQMEQQEDASGEQELSPEEREAYDRFMIAVQRVLYDSGYDEEVISELKRGQDRPKALADLAYELVAEVDKKSKGLLPDELVAPVAFDTLGEIAEVAKAAGATIPGRELASAAKQMIARYFTENGATPEEVDAALAGIDEESLGSEIDKGDSGEEQPKPGLVEGAQA